MNDRPFWYRIFLLILHLYPPDFRQEFGGELEEVILEAIDQAQSQGTKAIWRVLTRELIDLPRAVSSIRLPGRFDEESRARIEKDLSSAVSKRQRMLTLAVFLVPGLFWLSFRFLPTNPPTWSYGLVAFLPLLLCAALLAGLVQGLPRWSLPYIGLTLSTVSFLYILNWTADLVFPFQMLEQIPYPLTPATLLILQCFWSGFMWLILILLMLLAVKLLALIKRFHPFYWRLRRDWTQASFIMYGGSSLALVLLYQEYHYQIYFALASWLCLAAGAWLYLGTQRVFRRAAALIGGVTLAMWSSAAGILSNYSDQITTLQALKSFLVQDDSWFSLAKILLEWGWLVVFLLLPAILPGFKVTRYPPDRGRLSS